MDENEIYTLGIETSCDETAAAVVKNGRFILSNSILSQIDIHKKFGGVVPEVASRAHIDSISDIVDDALYNANITFSDIDVIAVTYGPGLVGSLLVGVSYAKSLAYATKKYLIGVNHIEAHICSNYLDYVDLKPPFVALVASGGHTHLFYVSNYGSYKLLGRTRDDAVGEAYDKVARSIGLDYPGGPKIDILAQKGDSNKIKFPKAMLEQDNLDFSFSGIKSSVLNYINKCNMNKTSIVKEDIAASFQKSIVDVLCKKAIRACEISGTDKLVLAGGVGCNTGLRKELNRICIQRGFSFYVPRPILCTDNAAMVASCGFYNFTQGKKSSLSLNANPNLSLIKDLVN